MASTKNGIIYPDNYDKVADVPADMKVLAESVDGNIERINQKIKQNSNNIESLQADNTTNKKSIENLKQENIEIKAENKRLRSDIESISLLGEAEGESIDLDDSSGARFKKFGIGGNHSQETREGYNLLENEGTTQTINGVTITKQKDGTLIVSGTATDRIAYPISSNFKLYSANTYRLSGCPSGGGSNSYQLIAWNEVWTSLGSDNGSGKVITLSEDTKIAIRLNITSGTVFNNLVFKPMLVAGETQKPYEQYGATPSLEFPSEIKTVKDNVNVVVCNENLFDKNNATVVEFFVDGENKIQSWTNEVESIYISIKSNTTYTVSKKISSRFTVATSNKVPVAGVEVNAVSNRTASNLTITSRDGDKYLLIFYYKKSDDTLNAKEIRDSIQIEKGSTATDYKAHQEQAITMPTQQEMLKEDYFDWESEKQSNLFEKIILDGVNKKCTTSKAVGDGSEFQWAFTIAQATSYIRKVYSNIAKQASDFNQINGIKISVNSNIVYVRSEMKALNGKGATVENVNELLKNMYDNGNPAIFYIEKASNKELDFTDELKVVAKKIKETLHTYKNITHIYSTDETSPIMNVEYAKDLNTQNNNLQNQINEIKQLISTTQTSAMLLDNLQKDVESEVE